MINKESHTKLVSLLRVKVVFDNSFPAIIIFSFPYKCNEFICNFSVNYFRCNLPRNRVFWCCHGHQNLDIDRKISKHVPVTIFSSYLYNTWTYNSLFDYNRYSTYLYCTKPNQHGSLGSKSYKRQKVLIIE